MRGAPGDVAHVGCVLLPFYLLGYTPGVAEPQCEGVATDVP